MNKPLLQLYITGLTPRSERAIANLRRICEERLDGHYEKMVIIDVLERPQLAEDEKILVTPTLIKPAPDDIRNNMAGFGWDIEDWEKQGKWAFVDASLQPGEEMTVTGSYDFGALLAAGYHAHLSKPTKSTNLVLTIKNLIRSMV